MAANDIQPLTTLIPLHETRYSPGRGMGLFAVRDLDAGTRILAEAPLMIVPHPHYMKGHVEEAFNQLSAENQVKYMSLASAHGQNPALWPSRIHESVHPEERERIQEQHDARIGPDKTILSIMMTNAMPWGGRLEGSAVFETASRCNHSCVPNAHFAWNNNICKETIHATKPIKAGTEITVAYCDPLYEDAQRSRELQHYGFKCDCKACQHDITYASNTETESNNFAKDSMSLKFRLREIDIHLHEIMLFTDMFTPGNEMQRLNQLMEANTLWRRLELFTPKLGSCCMDLAEVLASKGEYRHAANWAKEGYRIIVNCVGDDSPLANESCRTLDWFLNHQSLHQ